jgi:hypothetical protein
MQDLRECSQEYASDVAENTQASDGATRMNDASAKTTPKVLSSFEEIKLRLFKYVLVCVCVCVCVYLWSMYMSHVSLNILSSPIYEKQVIVPMCVCVCATVLDTGTYACTVTQLNIAPCICTHACTFEEKGGAL